MLRSARRVLVIAPHPDDEAIGAGGLIVRLRRAGARIDLVVASDGSASHPGSRRWPPARLVPERKRETRRAMHRLGLPASRIRFLSFPDGALPDHIRDLARALGRQVRRSRAQLIVGPVAQDAHGDHRAVAAALAQVRRHGERRLGYLVWPERARRGGAVRVALDGPMLCAKRRLLRSYRTQMGLIRDAEAGFAMTSHHLRAFVRPGERFEVVA